MTEKKIIWKHVRKSQKTTQYKFSGKFPKKLLWSDANHVHLWQKLWKPMFKSQKLSNLGFLVSETYFS